MEPDEPRPRKADAHDFGGDLSAHSIADLKALATRLREEAERVDRAIAAKEAERSSAEAFFKG